VKPIPQEVQFSPVYAAECGDFNDDGNPDILLGGNLYNAKPETGRYDASYGSFLTGDGKGGFSNVPSKYSGLKLEGEIRDIMPVKTLKGSILVISGSNCPVSVFEPLRK
jgi:hypothetical protein